MVACSEHAASLALVVREERAVRLNKAACLDVALLSVVLDVVALSRNSRYKSILNITIVSTTYSFKRGVYTKLLSSVICNLNTKVSLLNICS